MHFSEFCLKFGFHCSQFWEIIYIGTHDFRQIEKCLQTDSTTANTNGVATGERKTLPEMGTISRKLGVDELPPSSEAAESADLIGDHEDRGRTGNYILISVIFVRLPPPVHSVNVYTKVY